MRRDFAGRIGRLSYLKNFLVRTLVLGLIAAALAVLLSDAAVDAILIDIDRDFGFIAVLIYAVYLGPTLRRWRDILPERFHHSTVLLVLSSLQLVPYLGTVVIAFEFLCPGRPATRADESYSHRS